MNALLDLDGTLTDPREGIVQCIKYALTGLGEHCSPDAEHERYIGPLLQSSLSAVFGSDSAKIAKAISYAENDSLQRVPSRTISIRRFRAPLRP